MILILFLHVTDVFAMLLEERQPTTDLQTESTFDSYEGEPVFADPQHNQYGVTNFWWDKSSAKWEPWWDKINMTTRNLASSTIKDVTKDWKKGLVDKTTRTKIDPSLTDTLPVSYTTAETYATPTAGPIILTNISSEPFVTTTTGPILLTDILSSETFATPTAGPVFLTDISSETFATPTAGPIFLTDISSETFATPTAGPVFLTDISSETFVTPTDSIFLKDISKTTARSACPKNLTKKSETYISTTIDGPILLMSSEENKAEQNQSQAESALRATTHDYLLELLTASTLRFPQQNAAELIALRAGVEHGSTMMAHPKESDEQVPIDSDLYRQLGVDITPSLREPDADFSRESPVFINLPNDKKVKKEAKKHIADGKKPTGLPGWRLHYAGRTIPETNTPVKFPVLKDFIELHPGESFPSKKYPDHKPTPVSYEKLIGRSASPSKLAAPYQTSLNDADYYEMINSGHFIPGVNPALSSKSDTTKIYEDFELHPIYHDRSPQDSHTITITIADPEYYDYEKMRTAEQTSLLTINPFKLIAIRDNLRLEDPNEQNPKDDPDLQEIVPLNEEYTKESIPYSPVNVPQTIAIGSQANQNEDLQLPELLGNLGGAGAPPASLSHIREGKIDDTTTDQGIASATNADPGTQTNQDPGTQTNQDPDTQTNQDPATQTVASTTTQEAAISISQGNTEKSEKPEILPAVVAVRPTFTVPNMETTVATTLPPTTTTTTETTKFTLEMAPWPLPNNLPNYEVDWSQFNLAITTTALPRLLYSISAPEDTVLTTPHPMVVEMRTEMIEHTIGYFTVFMRKLLDIVSKKDQNALAALLRAGSSSLDRVNEHNVLMGLGRPMWPGIQLLFLYMQLMPLDTIKNQALLGHMYYKSGAIFNDDVKLKELDNQMNAVYQVKEGENLMKTLVPLDAFPGEYGEVNADKVTEDIFRAMLAPWFRSKNSDTMYSLLYNLNERFEVIEKRYLGGARRNNLQNKDTTNMRNSIENKKPHVGSKSKRTEDDSYYNDTLEKTIDNIVKHENEIIKTRSTNHKIRYNTKYKGKKTTTNYNNFHYGNTVKQKPTKKYRKCYRDNEISTKNTKYVHDEPSKDMNKHISTLISKKNTRKKSLFVKTYKNYNIDTNNKISKIANVYEKDKLKKRIKYDGGSTTNIFFLQNKETRSNRHDKKEKTRRNNNFNDRPPKQINDYDPYDDDKYSKIIDKRKNMMRANQKSALSKEKNEDYYTYDDSAKADSSEIKSHEINKKLRKSNKNIKVETTSKNYELKYRTTKKTNDYDSYDDDMEPKTIVTKVINKSVSPNNEFSKRHDDHYDTYDDSSDRKEIRHIRSKDNRGNHNTINAVINEVRQYKHKKKLEGKKVFSSFEQELKNKYQEIELFNKNLENIIKKRPESHVEAKKNETYFKNTKNHGNGKQKLSERVLQKRFEIKRNSDDTKNNSKNNKIWQDHVSSVLPVSKIKKIQNKSVLVKENFPKDFQMNSHKAANTENKENFWSHLKSQYIVRGADPYLKERFLDFNRDNVQTKKKYNLRNIDKNKNILRVESSYSDEEEVLKSNLQDNLLHGGRKFTDTLHKYKKSNPIRDISSYSDEEDTLKKNIYKTFT